MLQDIFETRYNEIRKTKDFDSREVNVLRLIISEIQRRENMNKKMEDKEVIKKLKMLKFGEEESLKYGKASDSTTYNIEYYTKYIPNEPTEQEIKEFINTLEIVEPRVKMMGIIMKHFNNLADGNIVKKILMEI